MKKNALKFTLIAVIAAVVVFGALVLSSHIASALMNGDWEYSVKDGSAVITKYCGSETEVTVPETIGGYTVTAVEGGVTSVVYGEGELSGLNENLKSVTLPATVTSIGEYAFSGCASLEEVYIPNSVTEVAYRAFSSCVKLEDITLPHSVKSIDGSAFEGCYGLTEIKIGSGLESIGSNAFNACRSLGDVYYTGTKTDWSLVSIGKNNTPLTDAEYHFGYHMHTLAFVAEAAPTCTDSGNTAYWRCSSCGQLFSDFKGENATDADSVTVAAKGHDFGKDGNSETCSRCGIKNPDYVPPAVNFKDVDPNAYYADAIAWAIENGITAGTSKDEFSPNEGCTRCQVVTFLWRAAKMPEPKTTKNPFTDVDKKAYYYKAVLWAVEEGITSGTTKTTFSPDQVCTRAQIVTFLWRSKGEPSPTVTKNPFDDVKEKDYYYNAVLWASGSGVTSGTTKTTFSPLDPCTRGQVVTFMFRCR